MGPISVSASASATSGVANKFGNSQQGDNVSGGGTNWPLVILGAAALALVGGLVWLVSRN